MTDTALFGFEHFNELGIVNQLATTLFERMLPHDLTLAQFSLLNHMVRLGDGWGPARLAAAFQVTKGALTNTLGKLEAKGFVAIEPDPQDGRGKRVMLTAAGRQARDDAMAAAEPMIARARGALTAQEAAQLLSAARKLRIWLDADRAAPR